MSTLCCCWLLLLCVGPDVSFSLHFLIYLGLEHIQRVAREPVCDSTTSARGHQAQEIMMVSPRVKSLWSQIPLHALESCIETSISRNLAHDCNPVSTHQSVPESMFLDQLAGTVNGSRVPDCGSCSILSLHLDLEQLHRRSQHSIDDTYEKSEVRRTRLYACLNLLRLEEKDITLPAPDPAIPICPKVNWPPG